MSTVAHECRTEGKFSGRSGPRRLSCKKTAISSEVRLDAAGWLWRCGHGADWIRALAMKKGVWANIPPKSNCSHSLCFSPCLCRARSRVEQLRNRIKQCRRMAMRHDRLAANNLASSSPLGIGATEVIGANLRNLHNHSYFPVGAPASTLDLVLAGACRAAPKKLRQEKQAKCLESQGA